MALHLHHCACGHPAMLTGSSINRAARDGRPIYCTRECAGLARRLQNPPTEAVRREAKAAYDRDYRKRAPEALKARKAEYYQRTRDPERERAHRKANMARHVEYCRRPEYVAQKSAYDQRRRAALNYGEFADAALCLLDLEAEVTSRVSRAEIYATNGTLNKKLNRRRDYDRQFA